MHLGGIETTFSIFLKANQLVSGLNAFEFEKNNNTVQYLSSIFLLQSVSSVRCVYFTLHLQDPGAETCRALQALLVEDPEVPGYPMVSTWVKKGPHRDPGIMARFRGINGNHTHSWIQ